MTSFKDLDAGQAANECGEHAAYYMYVVECADGTWYTGYTDDVQRRVAAHNAGRGARYTRSRLPVTLLASAKFPTRRLAMSAEWHFKRLTRDQKEALLAQATHSGEPLEDVLRRELSLGD